MKESPEFVRMEFKVDPYQGLAASIINFVPKGYRFFEMVRRGTKAIVTFKRIDNGNS